jgi:hypothetical protein
MGKPAHQQRNKAKLYGELCRLSEAIREDRLLRVWYGLRVLDDGKGWLPDDNATREALQALGVAPSDRSLRNAMHAGEGRYWRRATHHQTQPVIEIISLENVTRHLTRRAIAEGIPHSYGDPGAPVNVPVKRLAGTLADYRAVGFEVWITGAPHQRRRVDWRTLCRLWGRASRNTLKDRCKRSGVEITHNYGTLPLSAQTQERERIPDAPMGAKVRTVNGVRSFVWQKPNTYHTNGKRAARGLARKVPRLVREGLNIPPRLYADRQHYEDAKQFAKARNKRPDAVLYLLQNSPHPKRANIWQESPALV